MKQLFTLSTKGIPPYHWLTHLSLPYLSICAMELHHSSSLDNKIADALSLLEFQKFHKRVQKRCHPACPALFSAIWCLIRHLAVIHAVSSLLYALWFSKSTLKLYDTAFCSTFSVAILPVSIHTVCAILVHCFKSRKMQPSSIKGLLAGVQFHLCCLDPSTISLLEYKFIKLLLNGFKREKPQGNDIRLLHFDVTTHLCLFVWCVRNEPVTIETVRSKPLIIHAVTRVMLHHIYRFVYILLVRVVL